MPIIPKGYPPQPYQGLVRPMFRSLQISATGLSAQRQRLDVIASNIANAETTRTQEGGPYRRRTVQMQAVEIPGQPYEIDPMTGQSVFRLPSGDPLRAMNGVEVTEIGEDQSEGPLVYEPGHPDADATGYVRYPNVRITDELVDLMDARRVYEANATVFQSTKSMLRRSIEL